MPEPQVPFQVKAVFDYKSEYEDDLTFDIGQIITVTEIEDDDWFSGTYNGKLGMFPKNFVKPLDSLGPVPTLEPKDEPLAQSSPILSESKPIETQVDHKQYAEIEHEQHSNSVPDPETDTTTEPTESPIEEKHTDTSKEEPVDKPKPVGAVFPNQKIVDPYAIKKQFYGAGKSSYVPPITPRDNSGIGGHIHKEVPKGEVVRGDDPVQHKEEEGPRVSLKERIALLQKRQQEEAEAEAAALKRKEERKVKAQQEKEHRLKLQKEQAEAAASAPPPVIPDVPPLSDQPTGELASLESAAERTVEPVSTHNTGDTVELEEETKDLLETEEENAEADNAEAEEDEEGASDDEELKRKKLVERMAKISGGRSMFGMMGMAPPFGGAAPSKTKPTKKTESVKEEIADVPKAIPILPLSGTPQDLPKSLQPNKGEDASLEENDSHDEKFDDATEDLNETSSNEPVSAPPPPPERSLPEPPLPSRQVPPTPSAPPIPPVPSRPVPAESSSMAESDDFTESDRNIDSSEITPENINRNFYPSDSADDRGTLEKDIPIGSQAPIDPEITGYEADEDLSDRAKNAPPESGDGMLKPTLTDTTDEFEIPPPPPPTKIPSVDTKATTDQEATPIISELSEVPVDRATRPPPTEAPSIPPPPPESSVVPPIPSEVPPVPSRATELPSAPSEAPPIPAELPPSTGSYDDISSDSAEYTFAPPAPGRSQTVPDAAAPPIPSSLPRSSTEGAGVSGYNKRTSIDSRGTGRSLSGGLKHGHNQADACYHDIEFEIANLNGNSNWWYKGELPESLAPRIGIDLTYEIDSNSISKRGGKVINYRDYYILFHDLSQLVLELEFESEDPRSSVRVVNSYTKSAPIIRKDLLDKCHRAFSNDIVSISLSLVGSRVSGSGIVETVFDQLRKQTKVLDPVGKKSYGVTIYSNVNNSNVAKIDDIRPGDILCIKNGKFTATKGIGGIAGSKSVEVGEGGEIYLGIIIEYDAKKEKFKVLETDHSNTVKKGSYKLSSMKSGKIKVFRVLTRDYVGW